MGFQENSQEKDKIKVEWDEEIASPSQKSQKGQIPTGQGQCKSIICLNHQNWKKPRDNYLDHRSWISWNTKYGSPRKNVKM